MTQQKTRIAVIGAGISGLGAAYLLHPRYDVTVFEKNAYAGGHSRTIDITPDRQQPPVPVDTGFIVYNERNYPHLTGLFRHLGVPTQDSDMSFGASIGDGGLEYGSKGLFAQRRNLLRPRFWGMVFDILRFNRRAEKYLDADDMTLGQCLDEMRFGRWFRDYYLLAMGAAIWSCPVDTMLQFPAATFIRFFKNHGLLTVNDHPQWRTVTGGSRAYVAKLSESFAGQIRRDCGVRSVLRDDSGVTVTDMTGGQHRFDRVVFACHADEALALIENPTQAERDILAAFAYQDNRIVVHGDESFMPKSRGAWASWVYLSEGGTDTPGAVSLTYWMNNLQNLPTPSPVLVTLNPGRRPAADTIYDEHVFAHPVFTQQAVKAQGRLGEIQGQNRSHFCGAWQRYGFHEDGLMSAVNVAKDLGADIPWT